MVHGTWYMVQHKQQQHLRRHPEQEQERKQLKRNRQSTRSNKESVRRRSSKQLKIIHYDDSRYQVEVVEE